MTARRKIEHALQKQFGTTDYEYWNCGVEGYNTFQEVRYFKRFCSPIRPDHVIVTLHNNDYQSTPVSFYDDDGNMAVFSPYRPSTGLNPTLYQYSYIDRLWFSWQIASRSVHDDTAGAALIKKSLAKAIEKGVELQESKGDTLHPSPAAATSFVEQLVAEKFELK